MIPQLSYEGLYKLTDISLFNHQFCSHIACQIAMKRVVDCVAMGGKHYVAIQRMIRSCMYTTMERYANHKVSDHSCGLVWKPATAVTPLATAWNAISEAMKILYTSENNMRRRRRSQSFT